MTWDDSSRPLRDEEYPEPDPQADEWDTLACPECGEWVHEDVEQCPHCGSFISLTAPVGPLLGRPIIWAGLILLFVGSLVISFRSLLLGE